MNKIENAVIKYQIDFENKKTDGGAVLEFRIITGRFFLTRKEAERCLAGVEKIASAPHIVLENDSTWSVELYRTPDRKTAERGFRHYRSLDLEVFIQTM
ncbi:hypothetical protein [uncultured Treponema sp.]|uniref:hypothetical protein n=1 Tax=uncultured Treponema sp. TaxID=162155 RepID=UPI002598AEDD|nr:hypothetical protein [uncultured Treponema sp.]